MNKKEWLKSLLPEGAKRLPRKLKKKYLKSYSPFIILNETQFLNLFKKDRDNIIQSINRILNTPIEELKFEPSYTHDYTPEQTKILENISQKLYTMSVNNGRMDCTHEHFGCEPRVKCELIDKSECKLDNIELKGYLF